VGAVTAGRWLWHRQRQTATVLFCVMGFFVLELNASFLNQFFGDLNRRKYSEGLYEPDILEASQWLRPRFNDADAVFVTGNAMRPYIITVVGLDYDPKRWFREVREVVPGPLPNGEYRHEDVYLRYGKVRFLYLTPSLAAVKKQLGSDWQGRAFFIVRPGELGLHKQASPVYEVHNPRRQVVLQIFDLYL
jgi:hypothetical protein